MVDTDVLVVGGGPVGLVTGLAAARAGLGVRVIDQFQRTALHSYALAIHPGTLRLLEPYGLAQGMIDCGRRVDRVAVYHRAERVGELCLKDVPGPFPFLLLLPQVVLEGLLADALRAAGVEVDWSHQALSLDGDGETVTTLVARMGAASAGAAADGEWGVRDTIRVRSRAVVGADGFSSTVRSMLRARYIAVGRSTSYALFEFESEREIAPEVSIVFRDGTTDVLWPIEAHRGRWNFQVDPDSDGAPDLATFRNLVAERAPWYVPVPERIDWSTATVFDRRLVDRFGEERVWLAGEAAHRAGPIGAHNMNVGMREGHDLALCIRDVLVGRAPIASLERYATDRQSEWLDLLSARDRAECTPATPGWARALGGRLVECLPASGCDLRALIAQVGLRLGGLEAGPVDP